MVQLQVCGAQPLTLRPQAIRAGSRSAVPVGMAGRIVHKLYIVHGTVLSGRGLAPRTLLACGERAASADDCHLADQKIFAGGQWHDGAIIDRLRLSAGAVVNGPCLLVQPDATIYVDPGLAARVDDLGNIIIKEQE